VKNVAFIVHNHRAGIGELRFCLHRGFKHAPLSRVPLCVSWVFLVCCSAIGCYICC